MSEIIERMARAAFEYEQPDSEHFPGSGGWDGPLLNDRGRNHYRDLARKMDEARREPMRAMIDEASIYCKPGGCVEISASETVKLVNLVARMKDALEGK